MHLDDPEQYRIPPYPSGSPAPAPLPYGAAPVPYGYPAPYGYPVPYGAAPWPLPGKTTWPHGPDRPGIATAAAVLGFVTGGLTALGSFISLLAILGGTDLPSGLLALGLPCAGGLIYGGVALLRRDSAQALLGSAIAAVVVLIVALLAGIAGYRGGEAFGFLVFVVLAAVLPVVTGSLALSGTVRGWLAAPA